MDRADARRVCSTSANFQQQSIVGFFKSRIKKSTVQLKYEYKVCSPIKYMKKTTELKTPDQNLTNSVVIRVKNFMTFKVEPDRICLCRHCLDFSHLFSPLLKTVTSHSSFRSVGRPFISLLKECIWLNPWQICATETRHWCTHSYKKIAAFYRLFKYVSVSDYWSNFRNVLPG